MSRYDVSAVAVLVFIAIAVGCAADVRVYAAVAFLFGLEFVSQLQRIAKAIEGRK